jgi:hypothetical protein
MNFTEAVGIFLQHTAPLKASAFSIAQLRQLARIMQPMLADVA